MARKRKKKSKHSPRRPRLHKYPSPVERERIIEQRDELLLKLIGIIVEQRDTTRRIKQLARQYGDKQVRFVLDVFGHASTSRELIGEKVTLYRQYRQNFARFGGNRRFLRKAEYEDLILEHGKLIGRRQFIETTNRPPSARELELRDLAFIGAEYWTDITPPVTPPRPLDWQASTISKYEHPANQLLQWGWELDKHKSQTRSKKWEIAIPDLAQMVLDEGLLAGWPGEPASWAPYYALDILGHLQVHELAERLMALMDCENDWLSDRLPVVWGRMGPDVEPLLWAFLNDHNKDLDQRALMLMGLKAIAETYLEHRKAIIKGLVRRLREAPTTDADINSFVVFVLDQMNARQAAGAIAQAFKQGRASTLVTRPSDVTILNQE